MEKSQRKHETGEVKKQKEEEREWRRNVKRKKRPREWSWRE